MTKGSYIPSPSAYAELLSVCPATCIDGALATPSTLAERIGSFWLPNEPVLYIGMAGTSIRTRVGQYYSTKLGARAPHAGGWWLKTLEGLDRLYVHFAPCDEVSTREQSIISAFATSIDPAHRRQLFDTERVAPFANVDVAKGLHKRHGLSNYKVPAQAVANQSATKPVEQTTTVPRTTDSSAAELRVQSQPVTDKDRTRSYLRIPAVSKHAFPDMAAQLKVVLGGVMIDAPWRPNGSRSGTLGVGVDYMRGLRERNERLQINVSNGIYTILRK
ncbi:hypothetical protein KRR55_00975 [Paeniglutamicibacter sp. ABSL32-1]|uniref:hypothetical protein n=1 Tax=Paeniglutamicibacter quisquiliarum TaxID=2849498 RepID=UPI001C2D6EA4|nr:hypothetical protein [Paeniglutamicibacter quisquiliarum]MBV1777677.1 hypothetical protein [Paeniglutamicibacter quisquiliarum]